MVLFRCNTVLTALGPTSASQQVAGLQLKPLLARSEVHLGRWDAGVVVLVPMLVHIPAVKCLHSVATSGLVSFLSYSAMSFHCNFYRLSIRLGLVRQLTMPQSGGGLDHGDLGV